MTEVCVPEPFLYGLLLAAIGRDLLKNGGVRSLLGPREAREERSSDDEG